MSGTNRTMLWGILFCAVITMTGCSGDDGDDAAPQALQSARFAFLNSVQTVATGTISSSATAKAEVSLDASTSKLAGTLTILTAPATDITAVHVHDGVVGVNGGPIATLSQTSPGVWTIQDHTALTAEQIAKFQAAGFYVNVHTTANTEGEIRGQLMSFKDNIQPIFDDHCTTCHRSGAPLGRAAFTGLILTSDASYTTMVNVAAVQSTGMRVLPGDAENSVLYQRTAGVGFASVVGERMPLETPALEQADIDLIKTWILMGAMDDNGLSPTPQTPAPKQYTREAFLNSAQTGTTVASTITGTATFTLDTGTGIITGSMTVTGTPSTPITQAHIHDGFAGVNGGVVVGLTSADGGVTWTVQTTAPALTPLQMNKFIAGGLYVNVHTEAVPAGEIRGQLLSFKDNVQAIFNARCVFCHTAGGPADFTGLRLGSSDSYVRLVNQTATQQLLTEPTGTRVIPFDTANSVLIGRVTGTVTNTGDYRGSRQMPASANSLSDNDINTIKIWIDMGALNN